MSVAEKAYMSITIFRFTCLTVLALVVSGCQNMGGGSSSAPIVDKRPPASKPAEVSRPRAAAPKGHYIVQRGDTLFRISQEVGQSMSDLVAWNNLANPNDIKVDQVIRVIPPDSTSRAQTASVASPSAVEVRPAGAPSTSVTDKAEVAKEGAAAEEQKVTIDGVTWVWPAEGSILQAYTPSRKGISIGGDMGQPVVAAGQGTVLYASSVRGYGNLVIVKHSNTLLSAYAHNKTILVKEGQVVTQGQKIAEMGDSDTDRVKLHFEIRQQGKPVDPTKYLPSR